jgi:uncharacterized protein (DUF934 family)
MPYLIRQGSIKENPWVMFSVDDENEKSLPPDEPNWMVSSDFLSLLKQAESRTYKVGLVLNTDFPQENLLEHFSDLVDLPSIEFIAIEFPVYTDGRGFSLAWSIRNELGWKGELRALGDVLIDTVNYLSRCGFDSFVLKEGHDPNAALKALDLFNTPYQNS